MAAEVVKLGLEPPGVTVNVAEGTGLVHVIPRGSRSVIIRSLVSAPGVTAEPRMLNTVVPPGPAPGALNAFEMPSCGLVGMVKMSAALRTVASGSPSVI